MMKVNYEVTKKYDDRILSRDPNFDEADTREKFRTRFPNLSTVVINCFDTRAIGALPAVAREMPGQVYPGEIIFENGDVKSTSTIFPIINAGGHAEDAFRSIAIAKYFFDIKNVVVINHTRCGAWTFTPEVFFENFRKEYGKDPSLAVAHERLGCYENYAESLKRNVRAVRFSPGTPDDLNIYGYIYDIDDDKLELVVTDLGAKVPALV